MLVKDSFEIKPDHRTGHDAGLVVVLDTRATCEVQKLSGKLATIRMPSGKVLQLPIDEAKEHGPVNGLFFKGLTRKDIPINSEICVDQELNPQPKAATAASR